MDKRSNAQSGGRPLAAMPAEQGFTLIELAVVMVILGLLAVLGTGGWLSYHRNVEHRGSAQELVSALRNAQQASLAEAVTYCINFDVTQNTYQVYKFACDASGVPAGEVQTTQSSRVVLATPTFVQTNGSTATTLSFFPRGAATKGNVAVHRDGADKTYIISVEGLTGRVSLSG